jgi:hypothetical protein
MAGIKATDAIAAKWARVTPQRSQDYSDGIENPRRGWAESAAAAEATYQQGVQQAATKGRYGKGVRAAGNEKWQRKAREKGPQRFQEGVQLAQPDYQAGFAPYADTIRNTTLPPRYPKGDPRNFARVQAVGTALSNKRSGATT